MSISPKLSSWIKEMQELCTPSHVHLCDGSEEEYRSLAALLVKQGTLIPLSQDKRPNSFLARSDPKDVARVESRTFICTEKESDAGPTNHWCDPHEMKEKMRSLFTGCMQGRTLYVIPFIMGHIGGATSKIGVEITDSPYVVLNMKLMTRMGAPVLELLNKGQRFVRCMHSVGYPLDSPGKKDPPWPCNPENTYITHFPERYEIWSYGSGYGGNALLGKKCFALRIASYMAYREKWLAEHMLIVGVTNPEGKKKYFAAAFPSACGKTNMAMLRSTLPGWKVECVGDDIAWLYWDQGRLYAINPEAGFFGVAPGTSYQSNPNAMETCAKNALFTNVALTDEGDVWWEKMSDLPPAHLIDWQGKEWSPDIKHPAAHPNSRFTVSIKQCPSLDSEAENPKGVPISAIIFGGRRSDTLPLVYEATSWAHGVLVGAALSSERTAAAEGSLGSLRHDPFAMLPFCGYHMGEYFSHWLAMGKGQLPIFSVNWFQKDEKGQFVWPGFGDNLRVLQWIFARTEKSVEAASTPIGLVPYIKDFDIRGLSLSEEAIQKLFFIDRTKWLAEVAEMEQYFLQFQEKFPQALREELQKIKEKLQNG